MANYFSSLPNVKVRIKSQRTNNVEPYVIAKNIFRRIKLIDNIRSNVLGFQQYTIPNDMKPYQVAQEEYGSSDYDWIICICNNITNIYRDWPFSEHELYEYVIKTYGNATNVHHYETNEIRSDAGDIVLREGLEVNEEFRYYLPDGTIKENCVYPVSNFEYERQQNEYKSNIWLLRKAFIGEFIEEFESLVKYQPNDEVGDDDVKYTWGAVEEIFATQKDAYTTLYGQTPSVAFASSQELVNRTVTTTVTESGAVTRTVDSSNTGNVNDSGVISGTTDASSTSSTSSNTSSSSSSSSSGSSGGY